MHLVILVEIIGEGQYVRHLVLDDVSPELSESLEDMNYGTFGRKEKQARHFYQDKALDSYKFPLATPEQLRSDFSSVTIISFVF